MQAHTMFVGCYRSLVLLIFVGYKLRIFVEKGFKLLTITATYNKQVFTCLATPFHTSLHTFVESLSINSKPQAIGYPHSP
jgi:hypothetical protein